jgi:beta-lactamase superfamily II metal-dependent hydrolase
LLPLPQGDTFAEGEIWVHFIDVGQADAILIRSREHAVLIDAGTRASSNTLQTYLESVGITTLDVVIATHPHYDWMPDTYHSTQAFDRMLDALERNGLQYTTIAAGDVMDLGIIQMTAVAPNSSGYRTPNNYSIVMRMEHGNTTFLFTGDAETLSENEILGAGWNIRSDVLQAGHHGSRTSTSQAFLDAVQPRFVAISVGAGNRYGHPHAEVMDRLQAASFVEEIFRTDERGTIVFVTNGTDIYLE